VPAGGGRDHRAGDDRAVDRRPRVGGEDPRQPARPAYVWVDRIFHATTCQAPGRHEADDRSKERRRPLVEPALRVWRNLSRHCGHRLVADLVRDMRQRGGCTWRRRGSRLAAELRSLVKQ
jgi:hypothetical protein